MHSTVKNRVKIASLTCSALLVSLFTPEVTVELNKEITTEMGIPVQIKM
jgi:hypothetical protein